MKVAVVKEESRNFLQIGTESIEVSDYSLKLCRRFHRALSDYKRKCQCI